MLGLKLRDEFLQVHMPGTAISLRTSDNQGAAQKSPDQILSITYPTDDVRVALKALSVNQHGRPILLMGDRGRGKSHIMAVMHHAIESPDIVEAWLNDWGGRLGGDELKSIQLVHGYVPISEPVHNYEYLLLWDLIFDRHPKGEYYRGQFEGMSQPFPPRTLLEKMFEDKPACLILDEFQTWFTGLPEKDPKSGLYIRKYAFNFVQILSEIAKDRPELLILVTSVLDNQNDAFQQIHRQGPVIVDFRGPSARQDREKLLLHRLFKNRRNISDEDIRGIAGDYAAERFRLLHPGKSEAERDRIEREVVDCWPFSPELLDLLEYQILLSRAAQETRDMIRILARVFRTRGELTPIVTPADFFVDGESEEVQTLVDSIAVQAGQEKLRQIAQANLKTLRDSGADIPDARELVSSIWMRSMSPGKTAGGGPVQLHLDITKGVAIDDNAFQAELALLIENSVNIHGEETPGGPLWFGVHENPRAKVRACARNNKLWQVGAVSTGGLSVYPARDIAHLRATLRHILVPETTQPPSRVIVLGPAWKDDPWNDVDEADKPAKWDRPVLLVIPDQIDGGQENIGACLGAWLAKQVLTRRNTVRFLLLAGDGKGLFTDGELSYSARCAFLCSRDGWGGDPTYRALLQDFDRPLRQALKNRFNRFAILQKWDFQQPANCVFEVAKITAQAGEIPSAVEAKIVKDLFDQEEFKTFVLNRAKDSDFVGALMDDLVEPPPPNSGEVIPFLGETRAYEAILDLAAEGLLVLNVNGTWIGRRTEDATSEEAGNHIRSKAFRAGQEMRKVQLALPGAAGGGTVTAETIPAGGAKQEAAPTLAPGALPQPETAGTPGVVFPAVGDTQQNGGEGDGSLPVVESPAPQSLSLKIKKSQEPATGINLSGSFESWGVSSGQAIEKARIEFSGLTVQQVKQILQRIPSAFKALLEVEYKEGGE
ncbi:MAG: hypothetical protein P4L55_12930 [Syntrophobacteraceae bacterium]|nr:hypothetical protein [Syntrophobacteraceae bacterium]